MERELAFYLVLGFLALERVIELSLTRRNLRDLRDRASSGEIAITDTPREYGVMVALHAALIALPGLEVLLRGARGPSALAWSAAAVLVLAQALRYWAIASLGPLWNARGAVDPSRGFSARGPYRFIRHPNYLAVCLEFLALPILGGAWIAWLIVNPWNAVVLARRIAREDELLAGIPGYREAMGAKGALAPRNRRG